ncbi:MAG TPA: hypothetical protein VMH39_06295 [Gemmatimonadaceae bacterium]|nr:hypothetical protein [Gemmatimonadaceae bacterium]
MPKWIAGCLLAIVVVGGAVAYFGYRKFQEITAGGGTATVTIAATPARVFVELANADSLVTWRGASDSLAIPHHGMLVVGDTIRGAMVDAAHASGRGSPRKGFTWTVTDLRPNALLVLEVRSDSGNRLFAVQRDSLIPAGDSTTIMSTITSPLMDSMQTKAVSEGKGAASAMIGVSAKIMIAAFRIEMQQDFERLKARMAGGATPKAP